MSLSTNFTYARNKLLQVFETAATYDNPNRRITGRPLDTYFGYKAIGYFTPDDFDQSGNLKAGIPIPPWGTVHPGDIRYADVSGPNGKPDGQLTVDDQVPIGHIAMRLRSDSPANWRGEKSELVRMTGSYQSFGRTGAVA